ncbi:MAG: type III pantothenate kinase [Bacteroidales bacterium]|nr:type III pantothenate kinase [Bacteroidales bacterium]
MNLVIDIGNSTHKWAIFTNEGKMVDSQQQPQLTTDLLQATLDRYPIRHSICSAVGACDSQLINILKDRTNYHEFSYLSRLPIELCYETPQTLGLDRIANAVGAFSLYPHHDILSIQAGTCLVFDFVDHNGRYLGGSISPGLEMRFKALHHFTQKLPLVTKRDIDFFIGNSTQHSIESGVMHGIIDEINTSIDRYAQQATDLKVLLTGGDSAFLCNSIKNTIFAPSNIVLLGLHKILQLNVEHA